MRRCACRIWRNGGSDNEGIDRGVRLGQFHSGFTFDGRHVEVQVLMLLLFLLPGNISVYECEIKTQNTSLAKFYTLLSTSAVA
jgi:hypothetical protein